MWQKVATYRRQFFVRWPIRYTNAILSARDGCLEGWPLAGVALLEGDLCTTILSQIHMKEMKVDVMRRNRIDGIVTFCGTVCNLRWKVESQYMYKLLWPTGLQKHSKRQMWRTRSRHQPQTGTDKKCIKSTIRMDVYYWHVHKDLLIGDISQLHCFNKCPRVSVVAMIGNLLHFLYDWIFHKNLVIHLSTSINN